MKRIFLIIEIIVTLLIFIPNISYAEEDTTVNAEAILESQQDSLDISSFLEEAERYTGSIYEEIDINELFTSALTGKINNEKIFKSVISLLGNEIISSITVLGSIIVVIIIHSILKSISDGLENKSISQVTYYVQYILIVTLIMTNFVQILNMIRDSIQNLVGFMDSLIPILMTLMLATRKYSISKYASTNYFIYHYIYRKFY